MLHAPGQGRGSDRRGVFHARRPHLPPRHRMEELDKIVARRPTASATDLTLCVRLRVSSEHSKLSLASKFGVDLGRRRRCCSATRQVGRRARHLLPRRQPGDDARPPMSQAMERVRAAIVDGGGHGRRDRRRRRLPLGLSGHGAAAARAYFDVDPPRRSRSLPVSYSAELWCEPGRALCAEYSSLLVRVEKRRGDELYINDGAYGALFDAAHIGWRFPVAAAARAGEPTPRTMPFSFYGPTCDDMDHMAGPVHAAGRHPGGRLYRDRHARRLWLRRCAPAFNGFGHRRDGRSSTDEPMASAVRWPDEPPAGAPSNVVKL